MFIDERGSGRSERLEDAKGYTVENMAEDVEAVRQALELGEMNLLGHSYGGVLAAGLRAQVPGEPRAPHSLQHVPQHEGAERGVPADEGEMSPELRGRIDAMEKAGLFGHGKAYEQNRYTTDYMNAAWGEGYFPYLYQSRPDPDYDPTAGRNGVGAVPRDVGLARRVHRRRKPRLRRVRRPAKVDQRADAHHRGRPRSSARRRSRRTCRRRSGSKLVLIPRAGT